MVEQPLTWVSSVTHERPIIGKDSDIPRKTFNEALIENVNKDPDRVQYIKPDGEELTLGQFYSLSRDVAKACMHIGLQPFEGVGVLGANSIEWFSVDVGVTLAAGIPAGIYTTNNAEIVAYILEHSKSNIIFLDEEHQLKKVLSARAKCPNLKAVVVWGQFDLASYTQHTDILYSWNDFLAMSHKVTDQQLDERVYLPKPENICKLIYTSGTTGPPKAVMISHDNVYFTVRMVGDLVNATPEDRLVSFLPCSHIAANAIDIAGALINGFCVTLAPADALRGSLVDTLKKVRPTIFVSVPRVFEKIQEKLLQIGAKSGPVKRAISSWAKGVGRLASEARDTGDDLMPWGYRLADLLVFSNIKKALGLDKCKLIINTAAPMQNATDDYFRSLDFKIADLYGMSEASGPLTCNFPDYRRGTSGKPFTGVELKLNNKDTTGEGELCFRGRNMFMGYLNNAEESAKVMDEEGFIHSGDLGRVDDDGFITITGRAKDLIVTAGGENVAPSLIESSLISAIPAVSRAFAVGDKKKFMSCLLVPYMDENGRLIGPAASVSGAKTAVEAVADADWQKYISERLDQANENAISNAARVRKFTLLTKDFSVETGELTPTLKVKRRIVVQKFESVIEAMYG